MVLGQEKRLLVLCQTIVCVLQIPVIVKMAIKQQEQSVQQIMPTFVRLVTLGMKNTARSVALVMLANTKTRARLVKDVQQASFQTSLVQWDVLPAMRAFFPTPRTAKSVRVAHLDNPSLIRGSPPVPTVPQKRTTPEAILRLAVSVLTVPIM